MEIVQPPGAWTPGVTEEAPRPPLGGHRIRNGEIVNEGFVGRLAGRINRRAIGRVGCRASPRDPAFGPPSLNFPIGLSIRVSVAPDQSRICGPPG